MVTYYCARFHPAASLSLKPSINVGKLDPLESQQFMPAPPRAQTSALPSPLTSAIWMVELYSGKAQLAASLSPGPTICVGNPEPLDNQQPMPAAPRAQMSALP